MAQSSGTLGPYVRLDGISISQLPAGSRGAVDNAATIPGSPDLTARPGLVALLRNIITEAIPFIDGVAPKAGGKVTWKTRGSQKRYASSEAAIEHFERVVPGSEIDKIPGLDLLSADKKDETWFCRRSCHRNAAETGTASWEEFTHAFKEHHHETEDAFTATVIGAREAISWDTMGIEIEAHGGRWINTKLSLVEMKHKIDPKPLRNRTFPVLQLASSLAGTQEFIVVSIPVMDFAKSPHAAFATEKNLVVAAYASIERIRVLPKSGEIEWIMATASDAGGVLPQWMQNLAVPSMLAKDVDMFLSWIPGQRKIKEQAAVAGSPSLDKSLPAAPAASDTTSLATVPPPPISKTEVPPPTERSVSLDKNLPAAPGQ